MRVTKKTESVFEIEFEKHEVKSLNEIRQLYEVSPELFIDLSLEQGFRQGLDGHERVIQRINEEMELEDGLDNPPTV